MSDASDSSPPERVSEQLPKPLRDALTGIYGRPIPVRPEIDAMILSSARQRYRRRRIWLWAGRVGVAAAAVAAVVMISIRLTAPSRPTSLVTALQAQAVVGDVNGDGRVDVLDAFTVAKALRNGGKLDPAWDVNGDGKIDEKDVDWLARAAVRVEGGIDGGTVR